MLVWKKLQVSQIDSRQEAVVVLLTLEQVAERLGTRLRFVRRLIAEHRITYIKVGKFVRIAAATLRSSSNASHD